MVCAGALEGLHGVARIAEGPDGCAGGGRGHQLVELAHDVEHGCCALVGDGRAPWACTAPTRASVLGQGAFHTALGTGACRMRSRRPARRRPHRRRRGAAVDRGAAGGAGERPGRAAVGASRAGGWVARASATSPRGPRAPTWGAPMPSRPTPARPRSTTRPRWPRSTRPRASRRHLRPARRHRATSPRRAPSLLHDHVAGWVVAGLAPALRWSREAPGGDGIAAGAGFPLVEVPCPGC